MLFSFSELLIKRQTKLVKDLELMKSDWFAQNMIDRLNLTEPDNNLNIIDKNDIFWKSRISGFYRGISIWRTDRFLRRIKTPQSDKFLRIHPQRCFQNKLDLFHHHIFAGLRTSASLFSVKNIFSLI